MKKEKFERKKSCSTNDIEGVTYPKIHGYINIDTVLLYSMKLGI